MEIITPITTITIRVGGHLEDDSRGRSGHNGNSHGGDLTITNDNQNNSRGYSVTVVWKIM
jgi:hypothetical protein